MDTCDDWLPPSSHSLSHWWSWGKYIYFYVYKVHVCKMCFSCISVQSTTLNRHLFEIDTLLKWKSRVGPAFLYSFWLTLYKTDISLSQIHTPVLKVSILETVLFKRDFFAYVCKKQTNKKARSLLINQINVISCCLIKKEKIFFCPQNLIRTKTEVVFIY